MSNGSHDTKQSLTAKANLEICSSTAIHLDRIKAVETQIPSVEILTELVETFRVLGDPTRLRIVLALHRMELCVCDLATLIGVSVSAISHQLRVLRGLRIVKYRREGKLAMYSIEDEHINDLVISVLSHVEE